MVHVVLRREDRDARRLQADLEVLRRRRSSAVRSFRNAGRAAVTTMRAAPDCSSGTLCLPSGRET